MGKSIRCKREKRLRTLRRTIAEPHYAAKDQGKLALLEQILQAPSQYTLHLASLGTPLPEASAASTPDSKPGTGGEGNEGEGVGSAVDEAMSVDGERRKGGARRGLHLGSGRRIAKKKKVSRKMQRKLNKKANFPV